MFTELEERVADTPEGPRKVLVVTPQDHVVLTMDRLELLEATAGDYSFDVEVVASVASLKVKDAALIFRAAREDGKGSWSMDPRWDADQRTAVAARLVRAQLPTYRRLLGEGVVAIIHTGLKSEEETALRNGVAKTLNDVLSREPRPPTFKKDAALLRDLVWFHSAPCDEVVASVLPERFGTLTDAASKLT